LKRLLITLSMVLTLTFVAAGVALAQETSDKQHLDKGIELYNNKKYQEALEHLKEIDASKLGRFDQDKPAPYIRRAEEAMAKQDQAVKLMAAGRQALRDRKYVAAIMMFEKADQARPYLGAAQAKILDSLIFRATEGEAEACKQVQAMLKQAIADEDEGETAKAIAGYKAVLDADVKLEAGDKKKAQMRLVALAGTNPKSAGTAIRVAEANGNDMKPVVTPTRDVKPVETKPVEVKPVEVKPVEVKPVEKTPAVDMEAVRRQAMATRVESELVKARQAMEDHNWTQASMFYSSALAMDDRSVEAREGKTRADGLIGTGPKSLLGKESDWITIQIKQTEAKVRDDLARATLLKAEAKEPEDYNEAITYLRNARRLIKQNRYLSPQLREDLSEEVVVLWAAIDLAKTDRLREIQYQQQEEVATRIKDRERRDQMNREQQIKSLWTMAKQYRDVRQYGKAAEVLDRLLVVDPQNERARRFRDDAMYWAGLSKSIGVRVSRYQEAKKILRDVEEATIPWFEIYKFPEAREWQELTRRRLKMVASSQGESDAVIETRRRLTQKGLISGEDWSIHLSLTDTTLANVLDFIREVARARPREINILIDRRGIEDAGIDLDDTLTLDQKDISVEQALKMVLGDELDYVIQDDGTVLISAREKLNENLPVRTYFVQDLITPIPDFGRTVPRMRLSEALEGGDDGGGGGGIFDDDDDDDDETIGTELLQQLIERTVRSTEPWESMGGRATIEFYEKSGLMIVSQTADGHRKLSNLLDSLRRERAIMISVEARFITVTDAFLNDLTLDFDVVWHQSGRRRDLSTIVNPGAAASGIDYNTLPWIQDPPSIIGGTVLEARPIIINSTSSNVQGVSTLMPALAGFNAPFDWGATEGGMAISGVILGDIQVGFLIRAIQADRRSTTLFSPRLTLWNGQRAWIADGTRFGFVGDLEPVVAEAAVAWDPTIHYITAGALLDIKATVSADRRYVHLDLRPQVTQTPTFRQVMITAATPALGIATALLEVPTVRITELQTSVSIPDGGTLMIGGMKMFEEHDVESGVPVLSKVPILKRLFTNRGLKRGHSNMLILIKPTIIIQSEEEAKLGTDEWTS